MTSYLERLAKENPDLVTLRNVGLTEEGRPLFLIKVGKSPQGDLTRAIWIDAGNLDLEIRVTWCFTFGLGSNRVMTWDQLSF